MSLGGFGFKKTKKKIRKSDSNDWIRIMKKWLMAKSQLKIIIQMKQYEIWK